MDQLGPSVIALVTTLLTIGGGYLLARRYRQVGVGPAEQMLSSTLQSTMSAQTTEIATLRRQLDTAQATILDMAAEFKGCKDRLVRLERLVADKVLADNTHDVTNREADRQFRDSR